MQVCLDSKLITQAYQMLEQRSAHEKAYEKNYVRFDDDSQSVDLISIESNEVVYSEDYD